MAYREGSIDCLVGLQWGSEGKGKISAYLANEYGAMVRSAGPQAGHTFYDAEGKHILRQLPCGVTDPGCLLYLSGAALIDREVLFPELVTHAVYPDRLMIDSHAMCITEEHRQAEASSSLQSRLASTLEGVGAATAEKIWREGTLFEGYALQDPELYFYCGDVPCALSEILEQGGRILCEGTQGFGLSLNHGEYPYVTSRDVTASALLADAGVSPSFFGEAIGVLRTYPIRVGGNSGPTGTEELSWEEITRRCGSHEPIREYTTVTGRTRRVFEQSMETLRQAVAVNRPAQLAVTFMDYIEAADYGTDSYRALSDSSRRYVEWLEDELSVPVTLISTGPCAEHLVDRRDTHPGRKKASCERESPAACTGITTPSGHALNFYGYPWDSTYVGDFINRKMVDGSGEPWEPRVFRTGQDDMTAGDGRT